jgi:hypothetical protein
MSSPIKGVRAAETPISLASSLTFYYFCEKYVKFTYFCNNQIKHITNNLNKLHILISFAYELEFKLHQNIIKEKHNKHLLVRYGAVRGKTITESILARLSIFISEGTEYSFPKYSDNKIGNLIFDIKKHTSIYFRVFPIFNYDSAFLLVNNLTPADHMNIGIIKITLFLTENLKPLNILNGNDNYSFYFRNIGEYRKFIYDELQSQIGGHIMRNF